MRKQCFNVLAASLCEFHGGDIQTRGRRSEQAEVSSTDYGADPWPAANTAKPGVLEAVQPPAGDVVTGGGYTATVGMASVAGE